MAAVLASYALPVYIEYTAHAHRIAAMLALGRAGHYVEARRMVRAASSKSLMHGDIEFASDADSDRLPKEFAQVPVGAARPVYRLTVSILSSDDYRIDAAPTTDGPMQHDPCGVLSVDASGQVSTSGPLGADACFKWK
jgi:type IV pilus assembly protein PilE